MSFYYNLSQGGSILLVTLLYDMCYVLSILGLMGRVNKDHLVLAACWTLTIITIRWTGKKAYVQVQDLHQFRLLNVKNPYAIFGALAFALKWLYDPIHDQAVIFAFNFALLKGHRNICAQLGHRTLDLFSLSRPFVYNLTFLSVSLMLWCKRTCNFVELLMTAFPGLKSTVWVKNASACVKGLFDRYL